MAIVPKKLNGHTIIAAVVALLLAGMACHAELALALPDNARHGYAASCESCHVSPAGGGALTAYGRSTAAEVVSTWGTEEMADADYGLSRWLIGTERPNPVGTKEGPVSLGGNQRIARVAYAREGEKAAYRTIPMQADLELAVHFNESLTAAATWGVYGEEAKEGSRRHYVLGRVNEHAHMRAGRFFPAYGLMGPDHTTYARKALGFDEGSETVNGEFALKHEAGDLYVTAIYGQNATFTAKRDEGYDTDSDDETGAAVRLQARVGSASVAGISCLALNSYDGDRRACGAHGIVTVQRWLWATGEWNVLMTEADHAATGALNVELYRGVIFALTGESMRERRRHGVQLQWFPVPHWELLYQVRREVTAFGAVFSAVGVVHHYL